MRAAERAAACGLSVEAGVSPAKRSPKRVVLRTIDSGDAAETSSSRRGERRPSIEQAVIIAAPIKGAGRLYMRKTPARSGRTVLLSVLGLTPGRSLWGLEPWDMQLFVRFFFPTFGTKDRDDVESEEEQKHVHTTNGGLSSSDLTKHVSELEKHVHEQLGAGGHDGTGEKAKKPFYRVPMRRHPWGCEQYELHASWGDLFLDLAYVGAAYRLGDVVKESFYSCAGDCYEYNGGSSGGSGGSGGRGPGRRVCANLHAGAKRY